MHTRIVAERSIDETSPGLGPEYTGLLIEHNGVISLCGEIIEPRPETSQFAAEIADPVYLLQDGITFGTFNLNRNFREPSVTPVVISLALGSAAQTGAGRAVLNAFAQTIQRPILVIDMAGTGSSHAIPNSKLIKSTFDGSATSQLAIINRLGVNRFDVLGNSMGAVMAAKLAELAGGRIEHLVTFSAPSFEKKPAGELLLITRQIHLPEFKKAVESAAPSVRAELDANRENKRAALKETPYRVKARAALAVARYAGLMAEAHMSDMPIKLTPTTRWSDITGSADPYTNWRLHAASVHERNIQYPGSSVSIVLNKETHAWLAIRRWEMAAIAAVELAK